MAAERIDVVDLDPVSCRSTGCGWYHGAWPLLRALGLVATPYRNIEFFAEALGAAADVGGRRVLVTGAADAAMPDIVFDAFRSRDVEPTVTVLDRCPTPIDRIRASRPEVHGWVADVLTVDGPATFDVLSTHGLFPSVAASQRAALAARWAELLVPGGRLVTTTSLTDGAVDRLAFDSADAFVEHAVQAASSIDLAGTGLDLDDVAVVARRWASRASMDPVRSAADVVDVLESAGFDVEVHEREITGALGASGPWSARSARYAEISATRRP